MPVTVMPPIEAAAPPDLDGFAEPCGVGRLANQSMVGLLAIGRHPVEHLARAVDRKTFLIAGDEQADGAGNVVALGFSEIERGRGESGDGALHVGGAPSIEHAVLDHAAEGRVGPRAYVPRRHHVGMTGKA